MRKSLHLKPDSESSEPKTFEECVALGRRILMEAAEYTAKQIGSPIPTLREEPTLNGGVRIVVVWWDGEETNECVIHPIDNQESKAV